MSSPDINKSALEYWRITGYSEEDIRNFCKRLDTVRLLALITFSQGAVPKITISKKTWDLQQGHYGALCALINDIAETKLGKELNGSIIIWPDDGMHTYENHHFRDVPILAFGRSIYDTHTFLIPDPAYIDHIGYEKLLTEQRKFEESLPSNGRIETLFWRGAASGLNFDATGWRSSQRGFLTLKSKQLNNSRILDAKFTKVEGWPEDVIASIKKENITTSYTDFNDFLKYRYLIDADGICCAWISLYRKLASKSLTVKMQSENVQWYYNKLEPWKHYVPLRSDAEDVEDIYKWLISHPAECEKIVKNANDLISSIKYNQEIENIANLIKQIFSFRKNN
jgi:Glycosyl transferase family 90